MASIGSFTAEFLADVGGFVQNIKKASSAFDDFVGEITGGILKAHLIEDATKAAFRAIGDAIEAAVVQTANYGDEILAMSQKTGVATETLGGLVFAFKQGNASQEDLTTGLRGLQKNLELANEGAKKQSAAFEFLGIATKDAAGQTRPLNDVLLESADRLAAVPNEADRAALAIALYGKQGDKLIPTLIGGSEEIQKQTELAKKYSAVMSGEAAEAGDRFNDALGETQLAMQGLAFAVGEQLIPKLTALITVLNEYIATTPGITRATGAWTEFILRTTIPAFGDLMAALDRVTAEQEKASDAAFLQRARLAALKETTESFADAQAKAEASAKAFAKALKEQEQEAAKAAAALAAMNFERGIASANAAQLAYSELIRIWMADQKSADDLAAAADRLKISLDTASSLEGAQQFFDTWHEFIRIWTADAAEVDAQNQKISEDSIAIWKEQQKIAEQTSKSFEVALGNITSDFAKAFADVIFEGKSFSETMGSLFKQTAKSLFQSFLTGLFDPLSQKLGEAGKGLASLLSGGGGGGGGLGGLLGGLGGGGGGFLSFLGPIAAAFTGGYAITSALLNRGGGQQFPTSEYFGTTGGGGGFNFGGMTNSIPSYGPDSPAYLASQGAPMINVTVQGNLVGTSVQDLTRIMATEFFNLTRDGSYQIQGAR